MRFNITDFSWSSTSLFFKPYIIFCTSFLLVLIKSIWTAKTWTRTAHFLINLWRLPPIQHKLTSHHQHHHQLFFYKTKCSWQSKEEIIIVFRPIKDFIRTVDSPNRQPFRNVIIFLIFPLALDDRFNTTCHTAPLSEGESLFSIEQKQFIRSSIKLI